MSVLKDNPANVADKFGAVAVVGAGIGGMQAALDLANSGFKVYLLEKGSAIGGRMAQLDKTFPTNDCSMCIVSPKLVEVGRHPNIELLTHTEVTGLKGTVGRFKLDVHTRAKYIDPDRCTGCGECANHCPIDLPNEFDEGLSSRKAISKLFPQAIPNTFSIDKLGTAPCKVKCPAHISVQGYVALTAKGKFAEALSLIKKDNPLPAICGRVCHHPCESECTRGQYDQPIAIKSIKRFLADMEPELHIEPPKPEKEYNDKVAIIGSGPGGLSAGYYLAINGYKPTIFESGPKVGGMLRTGIPPYRLPRNVLNSEIAYIKRAGVEIKTDSPIGKDLTLDQLREQGYKAFFLATGAHAEWKLNIEGEDKKGVLSGYGFLRDKHLDREVAVGKNVVVVGGGNVAMDAARTALRLGAKVTIVYRRSYEQMPASPEEIQEAMDENIAFEFLTAPLKVLGEDKVEGLYCQRMELGEPDQSGRRRPVPVPDDFISIDCDTVITAIGQYPDLLFLSPDKAKQIVEKNKIVTDPVTLSTQIPGIFSGGDSVTGPSTVIEAIAAGKEAAESIRRFLRGENLHKGRTEKLKLADVPEKIVARIERLEEVHRPPEERIADFEEVCRPFDKERVISEAERCLSCGICSECYLCVEACQANAVIHNDQPAKNELNIGSVILAPGFSPFDPNVRGEFGYSQFPNVVTSLEFERILSASGPYQGHVQRPSDRTAPKRIAWIQCVGSRDSNCGNDYCSSVCCMYAAKEAVIAAEHLGEVDSTIFYMDLRAFGKGFDDYVNRAKASGVHFVNSMVSRVIEDPITNDLELRYIDPKGEMKSEIFDMVVLSVGMQIQPDVRQFARLLNVDLTDSGFAKTISTSPLATNVPGVFVAGAFAGPKDIPETVAEASAAAACASSELGDVRGTMIVKREKPPEIPVNDGDELRIGVFICHCGINIGSIVDVPNVTEYAKTLPGVVHAEDNLYTCSQDTQERFKELIKEHNLNRVVVASCSPRTHEPLFQETLSEAGLNPFLFDMANIRDQCSWVNRANPERATQKSKELLRMAVAKASLSAPLYDVTVGVNPRCLVIGGGLAGMTAALELSKQGFESVLVERTDRLGGNLWNIRRTFDGQDVQRLLKSLIDKVQFDDRIRVYTNALVTDFTGYVGNYETDILVGATSHHIEHGALILATGGSEMTPVEYNYGDDDRIITQSAFERLLADSPEKTSELYTIAMIQCVGSRTEERTYCSRVCCNQALKNSIELMKLNPKARVVVFYRDIRSYGLNEILYAQARKAGVLFVQYDPENNRPIISMENNLTLEAYDSGLGATIRLEPDLVVLSSATIAGDNDELGALLKLTRNEFGFFLEAHQKLRPVDFASDGAFLAGIVHGPKSIPETISQAQASVSRAVTLLSHSEKNISGIVSIVNSEKCAVCLTCVRACPYDVPTIDHEKSTAVIDPTKCHGCGICAADCPGKAIELAHYTDSQLMAKTQVLLKGVSYGL